MNCELLMNILQKQRTASVADKYADISKKCIQFIRVWRESVSYFLEVFKILWNFIGILLWCFELFRVSLGAFKYCRWMCDYWIFFVWIFAYLNRNTWSSLEQQTHNKERDNIKIIIVSQSVFYFQITFNWMSTTFFRPDE